MKNELQPINVKSWERKNKIRKFKEKVKEKFYRTIYWINDNKEFLIVIIPAALTVFKGTTKVFRSVSRHIELSKEKKMKENFIYDRSLGRYVELRRPLKNSDMKTILERKDNGEKLSNILMDMNLIK